MERFSVVAVPMTSMTVRAVEDIDGIGSREAPKSKNFFALGLLSWMYGRPTQVTVEWIEKKFARADAHPRREPERLPRGLQLR